MGSDAEDISGSGSSGSSGSVVLKGHGYYTDSTGDAASTASSPATSAASSATPQTFTPSSAPTLQVPAVSLDTAIAGASVAAGAVGSISQVAGMASKVAGASAVTNALSKANQASQAVGQVAQVAGMASSLASAATNTPSSATPASSVSEIAAESQEVFASGLGTIQPANFFFEVIDSEDAGWSVRKFELGEGISELYEATIDLTCQDTEADFSVLDGASALFRIERELESRRLCGIVTRVQFRGVGPQGLMVRVTLQPALFALGLNSDCRIFQEMSVKEILEAVLGDGLSPYQRSVELNLSGVYRQREYITQYNESDLDFARRLMAEEGISFSFDHSGETEKLVLIDTNQSYKEYESSDGAPVPVMNSSGSSDHLHHVETIHRLRFTRETCSTAAVVCDYDWTDPERDLTYPASSETRPDARGRKRPVFEYPAPQVISGYDTGARKYAWEDGKSRQKIRTEELAVQGQVAQGEGNVTGFTPGQIVTIGGEVHSAIPTELLILHVSHEGEVPEERTLHVVGESRPRERYTNSFKAIPAAVPFRPKTRIRPNIGGLQTARVVGPASEEVHTDEHGRIKVQFHWDRDGQDDDRSSCWVRTAQTWGGTGWGFIFIPRVGMEVVVQFLGGNPDRPIVTGCMYNGTHPPPYELPQSKTVSTIKTSSSPVANNGSPNGFNELRFEDAAGLEEIFVHAQKDLNSRVLHDHSATTDHDESITVGHDQQLGVAHDRRTRVGHDDATQVGNDRRAAIGNDQQTLVGRDNATTVGAKDILTVGDSRIEKVMKNEEISVGVNRRTTVGAEDESNVGGNQTNHVAKDKTETVGQISKETVGTTKQLIVKGNCIINVGTVLEVKVDGGSQESVKTVKSITAGEQMVLSCGESSITLFASGEIQLKASKLVKVDSAKVDLND